MPVYEYECAPCRVVYETRHGMSDPAPAGCPRCGGGLARLISAPNVNRRNLSSPTAARYADMTRREEVARERELQKTYERIWLPPPVKHEP